MPAVFKDIFLPIPNAPRYEVNGHGVVRNSVSKRVIQPFKHGRHAGYVQFFYDGDRITRRPESLYRLAYAEMKINGWYPVPSLNGKYELSPSGDLRNADTKVPLKKYTICGVLGYYVKIDRRRKAVIATQLLFEVYGYGAPFSSYAHNIGVSLFKDGEQHDFNSITACANFLAPLVFYSVGTIRQRLHKRPAEIWGWNVTYFEPQKKS